MDTTPEKNYAKTSVYIEAIITSYMHPKNTEFLQFYYINTPTIFSCLRLKNNVREYREEYLLPQICCCHKISIHLLNMKIQKNEKGS